MARRIVGVHGQARGTLLEGPQKGMPLADDLGTGHLLETALGVDAPFELLMVPFDALLPNLLSDI